ncbi:MAG: hypothetical protein QOJ09_629 [Actinomycetota bacterium]|nr:hypothetical protein [Actinomycetota bacterium]
MRFDRVVARVRERRAVAAVAGVMALVLAGSIVALVGEGGTSTNRSAARPVSAAKPTSGGQTLTSAEAAKAAASAPDARGAVPLPAGAPMTATDQAAGGAGGAAAGAVAQSTAGASAVVAPSLAAGDKGGAKVVKTATLRVQVRKGRFQGAFERAAGIAAGHGGYVACSSEATVDEKASEGTITVRVPADQFDSARRDLAAIGKVQHQQLGGQDVTAQIVDYDARIRSLQGQEQALSTLLSRARSVGEVLEVQGQLFNVRQQIEQLQAERANLGAQADMSTITLTVFEPGAALTKPKSEPATGLAHSWHRAWDAAIAVVGGMVIVTGVLLPLAVLGLLGWGVWRLASRRRRPAGAAPTPAS